MRKLAKGPAIAAAVFSILTILGLVVNLVNYLNDPHMPVLPYVTLALSLISTVLLIVVLFRRKADTFAAVACFAHIPGALISVISSVSGIIAFSHLIGQYSAATSLLVGNILSVLTNLLRIAVFVMMALQCFRKEARKDTVCIILPIVVGVLALAQTFTTLIASSGIAITDLSSLSPYMLGTIVGAIVGGVIGALPLIFTGMAFGKTVAGDQAPQFQAPLYQQYQMPQYQAPQYQAPQYQAPQYQAPQYQAPQYQPPQYQAPQYQAPQYQPPQYQPPQYQAPQYQAPNTAIITPRSANDAQPSQEH